MGSSVERRSNDAIRVPLEALVELSHDDFGDHFEADCVNLSARGLSMRAAYLPEPGTRLSCNIQHSTNAETIRARGEVVWAEDTGKRMGEFGVRFVELDAKAERMIYELVSAELARDTKPEGTEVYTSARLSLDGVASPIVARVTHAAKDLVTVEQELSFLKMGRGVSVRVGDEKEHRRGKIDGIDLALRGDVASLVLQVVYDEVVEKVTAQGEVASPEETTLTDFEAPKMDDVVGHAMPVIMQAEAGTATMKPIATMKIEANVTKERDPVKVIRTESDIDQDLLAIKDKGSFVAALAAVWKAMVIILGPICAKMWAKTKEGAIELGKKMGPMIAEGTARTGRVAGHWMSIVRARAAERFPALGSSEVRGRGRRVTSPAPNVTQRPTRTTRVQGATPEVEEKKQGSKSLVLAGMVIAGAAAAFFFFSRGDDELGAVISTPTARVVAPTPAPVAPAAVAPVAPAATAPVYVANPASTAAPVVPAAMPTTAQPSMPVVPAAMPTVAAAPVATPTAMPAPSYEAGRLPAPSFPSLRDAPRPATPPATVPANSPYAVDARGATATPAATTTTAPTGLMTFGAPSLSGGLIYTLRMDGRILGITGSRARTTLSIRVNGARSLDRAAPIFARNPQVERAAIVNAVDHSDLTITFREGMAPDYRVVARGTSLEVMLSR